LTKDGGAAELRLSSISTVFKAFASALPYALMWRISRVAAEWISNQKSIVQSERGRGASRALFRCND
jgi:hypothetical protein